MPKLRHLTPSYNLFVHLGYPYFSWYAVLSVKNKNTVVVIISDVHPACVSLLNYAKDCIAPRASNIIPNVLFINTGPPDNYQTTFVYGLNS